MRSISSPSLTLAFALLLPSCTSAPAPSAELRELVDLERALEAVAAAPEADRGLRLEEVAHLTPSSPRLRDVQAQCIEAYRAFLDAIGRMEIARKRVGRIEALAGRPLDGPIDIDASVAELSALHTAAVTATTQLETSLDRAEELVKGCNEARAAAAAALGAP
jgi:hypothetical protein